MSHFLTPSASAVQLLTLICSLLSISWLRPYQASTTKPNIGRLVLTNVLFAHPAAAFLAIIPERDRLVSDKGSLMMQRLSVVAAHILVDMSTWLISD